MAARTLPLFLTDLVHASGSVIPLDEDTSRHVAQVLRMQVGERLELTDGKGSRMEAELTVSHKRNSAVRILTQESMPASARQVTIAISFTKHSGRMEWFLEKATELGVYSVLPLMCARTEKQKLRPERLRAVMVSALLQSRQYYLPNLEQPISPEDLLEDPSQLSLIAHCGGGEKASMHTILNTTHQKMRIMIGPEGDFTDAEIDQCKKKGFISVSLGANRLRTETAGIAAAVLLCINGTETV